MATSRFFQAAHDVIVKNIDQSLTGQLDNFSSIGSSPSAWNIKIICLMSGTIGACHLITSIEKTSFYKIDPYWNKIMTI